MTLHTLRLCQSSSILLLPSRPPRRRRSLRCPATHLQTPYICSRMTLSCDIDTATSLRGRSDAVSSVQHSKHGRSSRAEVAARQVMVSAAQLALDEILAAQPRPAPIATLLVMPCTIFVDTYRRSLRASSSSIFYCSRPPYRRVGALLASDSLSTSSASRFPCLVRLL
ncbi:hypothetical protein BD626DRAFT_21261 [Schizophyllum amplum]|uniref:Uncharacterized protein n=1 Tax=Schizophyllum amplum TaxID=97359 RepID=A0A550CYV0_9AGAR|nr:hypothetical protein BD626DRAFT_21261 [Auriculariopsis ampla]